MTASGLPIDGESLLRFKKHHAPVAFEAAHHTAAVVLDTLSFRLACFHGLGLGSSSWAPGYGLGPSSCSTRSRTGGSLER